MSCVLSLPFDGDVIQPSRARRIRSAAMALVLPMLSALTLAVTPAGAQAATTGTIAGSLTVPSGTKLSDVTVQLADRNGFPVNIPSGGATVTPTGATTATYTITGVPSGQYYVYFSAQGSGENVAPDYYGDGGSDNIGRATVVTVPATGGSQTLSGVTLTTGATITGTVGDANSASETAANVTAQPTSAGAVADPLLGGGSGVQASVTSGAYKISGLPVGSYTLAYSANGPAGFNIAGTYVDGSGLTYDSGSATLDGVTAGGTTTANFVVPGVGSIGGRVTDSNGNPLSEVAVTVYDSTGNVIDPSGSTAVDGTYTISDVLPGSYEVGFDGLTGSNIAGTYYGGSTLATATKLSVSSGATTANVNGTLVTGATVSGAVTSAQGGAALGGITVELVDAQGIVVDAAVTNPDGTYTLSNAPAGSWYVEFVGGRAFNGQLYATEYYLGQPGLGGSTAVKLAAGQALTGINEALLPETATAAGLPLVTAGRLTGLASGRAGLSFRLAAGSAAGYLQSFAIKLPKLISWNRAALKRDISIPGVASFTYAIAAGRLVISFPTGQTGVRFTLKPGGLKVTRRLEKLAKKRQIASEGIALTVTDTTGKVSSASYVVKRPH